MDLLVEHLVRGQLAIIRRIAVAGAQRRPPLRFTLDRERGRVLGPHDVALDTGGGLGDERQLRAQRQVGPSPDVTQQVTVDHQPGGIAARVPRAQAHVVHRVAIAGPRRSDARLAAVSWLCRVSWALLAECGPGARRRCASGAARHVTLHRCRILERRRSGVSGYGVIVLSVGFFGC